jgi:Leucine-rich repeat (LRR) protein
MVGHNTAALVRRATESGEILNLGNNKLGSLSAESWKALGAAIEGNAAIKELLLHSNNLGALKPQGWKWLAQALERSPSVHKVLLMSNNLAKLDSPQAWEMFANALVNNERLDDLYLDDQGDIFHMLTERELTHFRRGRQAVAKRSVDRYVRQANDCRGLLKKTSAQLGSLHVASGGTDAWHRFSQAIKQNEHITGLLFNSNNLGELELASFKILAELVESSSTLRYLDLGGNHLEALDRADQTDGDEDAEGAGSRGRWAMLTNALHRNRSLRDLSLRGNDLSAISDAGWAALMNFLEHNTSIIDLSLRETGLGKMPLARWEQLACAIRGNSTLLTLQLRGNAVRQQCSLQIKRVLAGSLMGHRTLVHVYGADDLFRVLGPFAHTPSYPWKPAYMSFWEFRASLFYGIFPFSSGALLGRLFWLSLCLVAFLAPRWYSTDWDSLQGSALRASLADLDAAILLSGQSVNGTDAVDDLLVQLLSRGAALEKLSADSLAALASGITKNASIAAVFNDAELAASVSSNATELITVGALGKLCTHVPDALNHAYVNAVSGYSILLASYLAMMVYMRMGRAADKQRKGTWRGCGVGSAAAACAGGRTLEEWAQTPPFVCCRRHLASGARCISQATQRVLLAVMPSSSSSSSSPGQNGDDDETETAGGGDKKSAESARNVRDSDSHQKAFFMLVQVLCAFNALGTYFNPHAEFVPTGSGLCKPAFVGLSVFFKPLALPVTYCILVASDTSGRM